MNEAPIFRKHIMDFPRAQLVPELLITNLAASKKFWVNLCGFSVMYSRDEEGFAFIDREGAQLMLEEMQSPDGNYWITGALDAPFGRGINFEIKVTSLDPILSALAASDWPLYIDPEERRYRVGNTEIGVRQFLVQDPDGYLVRFSERLGQQ